MCVLIRCIIFHGFIAYALLLAAATTFARPVLLEFFTSSASNDADSAEQAIAQLRQEFSSDELHLLVYQLNGKDPDYTFENAVRALQYGVKTSVLPVAVFNGASRIEGFLSNLYPSYRSQILEKMQGDAQGEIRGVAQMSADSIVASVSYQTSLDASSGELDLYFAVTENRSSNQPGVLLAFQYVDALSESSGQAVVQLDRFFTVKETQSDVVWWIEDPVSREIVHSSRAVNIAPLQWDANGDGEWSGLDLFWLPFLWGAQSNAADLNRDGNVNPIDLLRMIKSIH